MSLTPYSYGPSLALVSASSVLIPVVAEVLTNSGSSGGQYESVGGWRVILRNRGGGDCAAIASTTSAPVDSPSTAPLLPVIRPGEEMEYGISPQAAEGLTGSGGGLGSVFTAVLVLNPNDTVTVEYTPIQTDVAPTLSY